MSDFERSDMYEDGYGDMSGMGGQPAKKKKAKKTKGKKVEGKLTIAFVALALMFITFVVLVILEDKLVNGAEKVSVVVATAEVPEGIELTMENMPGYFAIEERVKDDLPDGVNFYDNGNPLIGKVTGRVIHPKEVITNECFYEGSFFDGIEDAVELSIDLGAVGQTVGGVLRPGDRIDIKAVIKIDKDSILGDLDAETNGTMFDELDEKKGQGDELINTDPIVPVEGEVYDELEYETASKMSSKDAITLGKDGMAKFAKDVEISFGITGEYVSQVIAENVVVVDVFNSGGENLQAVEAAGGNMIATVINVAVPSYLVDSILIAQAEGTVTLSRVEPRTEEEVTEEELVEDMENMEDSSEESDDTTVEGQ